jgi:hypothetical protein
MSKLDQLRALGDAKRERQVTQPVTRPVTKAVTVTPIVTCPHCEGLRAEIADLKSSLAQSQRLVAELRKLAVEAVPRIALTGAERVRRHRERRATRTER